MKRDWEIPWAAGIIEGEGYIGVIDGRTKSDGTKTKHFLIRVVMADRDIISRLNSLFGGVDKPYSNKYGLGKKQLYRWQVNRFKDVKAVAQAIRKFMGLRRGVSIDRLLSTMSEYPFADNAEKLRRGWLTRKGGTSFRNVQL